MKILKKILTSPAVLAIMLIIAMSTLLTACGDPYKNVKVVLPDSVTQSGLVMELDENNTASTTLSVSLENAPSNVSKELLASSSSEKVVVSTKYVVANVSEVSITVTGIVNNVQITVTALDGNKSASFYVSSVKRVTGLQSTSNLSLLYVVQGTPTTLTSNLVSFIPSDTTEKDVEFSLPQGISGASIENNVLLVSDEYVSTNNTIDVLVSSKNNPQISPITITLNVLKQISYTQSYFYSNTTPYEEITPQKNNDGYYEFTVANNLQSKNSLLITIKTNSDEYIVTPKFKYNDIAEVVSYQQTSDVYSFIIRPKGSVGSDELVFEIKYSDYEEKVTTEKIIISAYDTVSTIRTYSDGTLLEDGASLDVYDFYANVKGLELSFEIGPTTVSQNDRGITIELETGAYANFVFYNSSGNIITPTQNEQGIYVIDITSGDTIYVASKENVTASSFIRVVSKANNAVSQRLNLVPKVGAKSVAFYNAILEDDSSYYYYLTSNQTMTKQVIFLVAPTNINLGYVSLTKTGNAFDIVSSQPESLGTIVVGDVTYNSYGVTIASKEGVEEVGELRIRLSNGQILRAKVEVFEAMDNNVSISVPSPQQTSVIGNVEDTIIDGQNVFVASIKRGETVGLNVNANTNVVVTYDFGGEVILGDGDAYADSYQNAFENVVFEDLDYVNVSQILNSIYLNNFNQLIVSGEGKVLVRAKLSGYYLNEETGEKQTKEIYQYFIIESYIPITSMLLSRSSATLYSEDSVGDANKDSTTLAFNLVFNNGDVLNQPTYDKVTWAIQNEEYNEKGSYDINVTYVGQTQTDIKTLYTVNFSEDLKQIKINAKSTYQLVSGGLAIASVITDNLLVMANEFGVNTNRSFYLVIRRANKVQNIILDNVTVENGIYLEIERNLNGEVSDQTFDIEAHADTSNVPLNTNLIYEFLPNDGTDANVITVNRTSGLVTLSKNQTIGGSGFIRIAPEDCYINGRYEAGDVDVAKYIPIKIADGRSRETSYEVETLEELRNWIKNYPMLYYTIIFDITDLDNAITTPLDKYTDEDGTDKTVTFIGGLFGKLENEENCHTLLLNGTSLFTIIGDGAIIQDLTLIGEATDGFVAQENDGTIKNVTVDTWVNENVYLPSSVTPTGANTQTGGIVAINRGTISNVKFYGSIENNNPNSYVGGIAGINEGDIDYAEVEFYRYSDTIISSYTGTTIGGLVGKMSAGTLTYSYAYSYVTTLVDGEKQPANVLFGLNIGALVGEINLSNEHTKNINASFAKVNTDLFVGNYLDFANNGTVSYLENVYMFASDEPYKMIANYKEIDTPSVYPGKDEYTGISFGSNELWNFASNVNLGYPYFNAIMQDEELDDISVINILNSDLSLVDNEGNVIFFYYEADGITLTDLENAVISSWNTVSYKNLFGIDNYSSIRIIAENAPIFAGSSYINIQGVNTGAFTFSVFSKYDYTLKRDFNAVILYKISDYALSYAGRELGDETSISIKHGKSDVVSTSVSTSKIAINRNINLVQNDLSVECKTSNDKLVVDGDMLGVHNIQTSKMDFVEEEINVDLILKVNGLDDTFSKIISDNFTKSFKVKLFNGADNIISETKELTIEPIDSHAQNVEVVIYTDRNDEKDLVASILNDETLQIDGYTNYGGVTVINDYTIENSDPIDSSDYPGISNIDIYNEYRIFTNGYVEIKIYNPEVVAYTDKTMTTVVNSDNTDYNNLAKYFKQTYKVTFGIIDDNKIRALNYNGKLFEISLFANSTGVSTNFDLKVDTQKLSYINTSHYPLSGVSWENVDDTQRLTYTYYTIPQSLLAPGDEGLLNIELFPTYSNYSYIEVTTKTINGSAYQVRLGLMEKLDNAYKFIRKTTGYETFTNGIRVFNPALENSIGSLYLRTFIPSDIEQDTVYELKIVAYDENGVELKADSYRLSVQHIGKPDLYVNGEKQAIIARGGSGEVSITVNADQDISSLIIDNIQDGIVSYDPLTYTIDETTNLKKYTTNVYFSTDLTPKDGDNYITITAITSREINGSIREEQETVYVAVADFVLNEEGTQLKTDAYNKDVLTVNVGTTQKLEFDFDVDFYLANDSLSRFNTYNYYSIDANPDKDSYIVNGFYDNLPFDFDYDSSNSVIVANFIDNLYYVNNRGDSEELSKVFNRQNGQIQANGYCSFVVDGSNLYVRGLEATTGSVDLLLRIPIQIPNGTDTPTRTYLEYYFTINVVLETNEDKPVIVDTAEKFLNMVNSSEPLDYILTEDIYLLDYTPINTTNVRSFDGNNKTIHILSYNIPTDQTSLSFALFNEVLEDTTLKNIRVNTYYGGKLDLNMTNVTSVDVAGFAITNNGIITNCEVVAYSYVGADRPAPQTPGLTVNYGYSNIDVSAIQSRIAGFVINNENGSITNSRVGGTSLEIANGTAIIPSTFNIVGQGDIAGFVYTNSGIIASSFFMNGTISNQTSSGSDTSTAGFVVNNNGEIRLSYAKGVYANTTEIHATGAGIETASVGAGFAYENSGIIEDSYSNIMLTTIGDKQSGRLSAGFVYINNAEGIVRRSYSASRIENSNSTQMNFLGVDVNLNLQNYGLVENSYYYNSDTSLDDEYASSDMESLYNTTVNRVLDPDIKDSFYGFAFSNSSVEGYVSDGVWYMTTRGPELVSANNISVSSRILKVEELSSEGDIVDYSFTYADGYRYGSSKNPIIIRNETEFNQVFGGDTANVSSSVAYYYDLVSNKAFGNYRIVNNIDLSNLLSDETGLTLRSTEMSLTPTYSNQNEINGLGLLDGNSFTISGIELVSTLGGANTSYGLFKELENGAVVMNLNLVIEGVNATGVNYVGALAGTVNSSRVINVSVSSSSVDQNAVIYGYNTAGGVAGRIIGDSYVSNVSAENLTIIAGNEATGVTQQFYNRAVRNNISYAGGIAGVIDIYTNVNDYTFSNALSEPNVLTLKATGNMQVYGATVGGVVGFLGSQTMLQDALFELSSTQDDYSQKLVAYKFSAGGIVGENYGYIFMVRAEHASEDQLEIENNYATYYNSPSDSINRGNLSLFEYGESTSYTQQYIGGIVGEFVTGKLEKSYSKINVKSSNATYAGGIIGGITDRDNKSLGGLEDYGNTETLSLSFEELYSTGDLFANVGAGGIFGYIASGVWNKITLEKINAINYLSVPTTLGSASGEYSVIDGKNYINNIYDIYYMDSEPLNIVLNQTNYDVHALESYTSQNIPFYTNKSLSSAVINEENYIIYEDVQNIVELKESSNADYVNEMNKIFRNAGWDQEYWVTESDDSVPHLFPHLTFRVEPSVIYIRVASDLEYLQQDSNKTFVIIGTADNGIVEVGDWLATTKPGFTVQGFSGLLRGFNASGNYGLDFTVKNSTNKITNPLFESTITGAQFSNFVIKNMGTGGISDTNYQPNISSILVDSATGTTFENIVIENCSIAPSQTESNSIQNYDAGLLIRTSDKCSFSNIEFTDTYNNNINLTVDYNSIEVGASISVGMIAGSIGYATSKNVTVINGVKLSNTNINITFIGTPVKKNLTLNVGHIAGRTGSIDLDLVNYEGNLDDQSNVFNLSTVIAGTNSDSAIQTLNAGGLVGKTNGSIEANLLQKNATFDNLDIEFSLSAGINKNETVPINVKSASVGGLFGIITAASKYMFTVEKLSESNEFRYYVNNNINLNVVGGTGEYLNYGGAIGQADGSLILNNVETQGKTTIKSSAISNVGGIVGLVSQRLESENLIASNDISFEQSDSEEKDNMFGGIVAKVGNSQNNSVTNTSLFINYSLNECLFDISSSRIYFGGVIASILNLPNSSSEASLSITNCVSGGSLVVNNSAEFVSAGGIVGSLVENTSQKSINAVIAKNVAYTDLQFKSKPSSEENTIIGGIVGRAANGSQIHTNYSLTSIIYPYSRENEKIGVVAGEVNGSFTDKQNYYSNQLSLMVATESEVENLKVANLGYNSIITQVKNSSLSGIGLADLIGEAHYGSKLNPFYISPDGIIYVNSNRQDEVACFKSDKNKWIIENNSNVSTSVYEYLGQAGQDPFSIELPERKYFKVEVSEDSSLVKNLNNIELKNSAIFADGATVQITTNIVNNEYETNTFINKLDENSFVTGIKVYVDTRATEDTNLSHYEIENVLDKNNVDTGNDKATAYYGGLVGINNGIVYACNSVNSDEISEDTNIEKTKGISGGISINNIPDTIESGDIKDIPVNKLIIGGLVAINGEKGFISDSFSMVDIITDDSTLVDIITDDSTLNAENISAAYIGGLVGLNQGQIDSCYSTGYVQSNLNNSNQNVYSFSYDDKFKNSDNVEVVGEVKNSYTIAKAKSAMGTTGVFGQGADTSNYYDQTATELTSKSGCGTKFTVDYMSVYNSLESDILTKGKLSKTKFAQNPTINYGYPYFGGSGYVTTDTSADYMKINTGDGSESNPFQIPSAGKWQQLTKSGENSKSIDYNATTISIYNWSQNFELVYDIDFESAGIDSITPVGKAQKENTTADINHNYFTGNFDGNNKIISNVEIENDDELAVGLFGYVGDTGTNPTFVTIQNVILSNCTITASKADSSKTSAGAILGIGRNVTISNCHSINNKITAYNNAGGIAGSITEGSVVIEKCSNTGRNGKVFSNGAGSTIMTTAGGILGYVIGQTESNDENSSRVSLYVTIEECYNTGYVVAGDDEATSDEKLPLYAYASGILGTAGKIADYTKAEITYVENKYVNVNNSYNKGNILANAMVPKPVDNAYMAFKNIDGKPVRNEAYKKVGTYYMLKQDCTSPNAGYNKDFFYYIYGINLYVLCRQAYASGISTNTNINGCYNVGEINNNESDIATIAKSEQYRLDYTIVTGTSNVGEKSSYTGDTSNDVYGESYNLNAMSNSNENYEIYHTSGDANYERIRSTFLKLLSDGKTIAYEDKEVLSDVSIGAGIGFGVGAVGVGSVILAVGMIPGIGWAAVGVAAVGALIGWVAGSDPRETYDLLKVVDPNDTSIENKIYINDEVFGSGTYTIANSNLNNSDFYTTKSHPNYYDTDSYVAPLGYSSNITSSYFLEDKCNVSSSDKSGYNFGNNNLGNDYNSKRTLEQLTNEYENSDTYKSETTINYSYISEDSIDGYYTYYLPEDEITVSKSNVSLIGNEANKEYTLIDHKGQQYLYYNKVYDVGSASENELISYAWQIDGQINSAYSMDDYIVIKMPNGDNNGIMIPINQKYVKLYYKNENDLTPIYETSDDNKPVQIGWNIKNPYVVIYDVPGNYSNPIHVRLSDEIYISLEDYTEAEMILNYDGKYAGMFRLQGALEISEQVSLDNISKIEFNEVDVAIQYSLKTSSNSATNLYIGKLIEESYAINFNNTENRAYFTFNNGYDEDNLIRESSLYVYNQGANGSHSTITINPNYLFPEGQDITESSLIYKIYRETSDRTAYVIGFLRERKISADPNVAKIDRVNGTITVNYWSIGADTSPWNIDSDGVINEGLPYLKNLPIEYTYLNKSENNNYTIFTTPKTEGAVFEEVDGGPILSIFDSYQIINEIPYIASITQKGENEDEDIVINIVFIEEIVEEQQGLTTKKYRYWTSWDQFYSKTFEAEEANYYNYTTIYNGLLFKK